MESLWQTLQTKALLGTARDASFLPPIEGISAATVETQMLSHAALLGTLAKAQIASYKINAAMTAAEPETLPEPSQPLQSLISEALTLDQELVPEVLSKVQRLPFALLPKLLEFATQASGYRASVEKVLGKRGEWLARQEKSLYWALSPLGNPELWEEGLPKERKYYLSALRKANPSQALELLQSTWKQEKAADRADFLKLFKYNLSLSDEALLEQALSDRAKDVRTVAKSLLVQLPQSAYVSRACGYIFSVIECKWVAKKGILSALKRERTAVLEFSFPETLPENWKKDGIEDLDKYDRKSPQTHWLEQLLEIVPLQAYMDRWNISASELYHAFSHCDFLKECLYTWLTQAIRDKNTEWLGIFEKSSEIPYPMAYPSHLRREQLLRTLKNKNTTFEPTSNLFSANRKIWIEESSFYLEEPMVWDEELSDALLSFWCRTLKNYTGYQRHSWISIAVFYLHPSSLKRIFDDPNLEEKVEYNLDHEKQVLDFRLRLANV